MNVAVNPSPNKNQTIWFLFVFIFAVLIVRVAFPPDLFADFSSYSELISQLRNNDGYEAFVIEPLSKMSISFMGILFAEHTAVTALAYINTLLFVFFFCLLVNRKSRNPVALILLVGLYAPLMAFVALRAMPAYLIAAFAVEKLFDHKHLNAILYCLIASLFHFSAVLLLPPILFTMFLSKQSSDEADPPSKRALRALLLVAISIMVWFGVPRLLGTGTGSIIPVGSLLSRYAAYLSDENSTSLGHLAYFLFVNGLVFLFLYQSRSRQQRAFAWTALIVFSILSFSPVVAFRYSLYFMVPLLLNFCAIRGTYASAYFSLVMVLFGVALFSAGIWQALQL